MKPPPDPKTLIAEAEALIANAQRSLQGSEGIFRRHEADARQMLVQLKRQRESELRSVVREQMNHALVSPALPAAETELDAATRFARQVHLRRSIV